MSFGLDKSSYPLKRPKSNAGRQIDVKVVKSTMRGLIDTFRNGRDLSNIRLASATVAGAKPK